MVPQQFCVPVLTDRGVVCAGGGVVASARAFRGVQAVHAARRITRRLLPLPAPRWYGNNCIHSDHCSDESCYQGDVDALISYGFDSVKLDGCGAQKDIDLWSRLINATGKAILIEVRRARGRGAVWADDGRR